MALDSVPALDNIPVTLLTGFLGSGKTTLLRRVLSAPEFSDTAVVINEVGEIVGSYIDGQGVSHGYMRTDDGSFITVDVPGATATAARGISNRGSITGQFTDASGTHAFVLTSRGFTTIDVPGAAATFGRGINERGDVAGNYSDAVTRRTRGFVATKPK